MFSTDAERTLQRHVIANPQLIGKNISIWVKASSDIDQLTKGAIRRDLPEIRAEGEGSATGAGTTG